MQEATQGKLDAMLATFMPKIQAFQDSVIVKSITQGMMKTMPILMASAILQLFYSLPIEPWTNFLASVGLTDLLTTVVSICNMSAVFMCAAIASEVAAAKGADGLVTALLALLCFLVVTPLTTTDAGTFIDTNFLGAMGIFTAMIVAVAAGLLYSTLLSRNLTIKLPEAVPPFVTKSFEGIPAAFLTVLPFIVLRGVFAATPFGSVTGFVYGMLQAPLTSLGNTLPAHLIATFLCCLLWWCGVHGTLVVLGVLMALWTEPMMANIAAAAAGQPAPYILSFMTFFLVVQFMGGPGTLFGLYVNMLFAKSERYKAQAKMSFIPGIFNIIEPTVFGMPIVFNVLLLIPFTLTPVVVYLLYYLLASAGIVGVPTVSLQVMVLPGPIAGFLLGGGVSLGLFTLASMAFSVVAYFPFFRALDRQALAEEHAAADLAAAQDADPALFRDDVRVAESAAVPADALA